MNFDISKLLEEWAFEPGQVMVRRFTNEDGREKIQMRLDLGLLQMNALGRPDGKRPHGHETLLEFYLAKKHRQNKSSKAQGPFLLTVEDLMALQLEAIQYHHRCLCLFQLEDFQAAMRDARHNLELMEFLERHAEDHELAWSIQQLRPQVLMMRTRAKATLALSKDQRGVALTIVEKGLEQIREFFRGHDREDLMEYCDEIHSLEDWREDLHAQRPLTEKEKLKIALDDAVEREDYEQAAQFRDALRHLRNPNA